MRRHCFVLLAWATINSSLFFSPLSSSSSSSSSSSPPSLVVSGFEYPSPPANDWTNVPFSASRSVSSLYFDPATTFSSITSPCTYNYTAAVAGVCGGGASVPASKLKSVTRISFFGPLSTPNPNAMTAGQPLLTSFLMAISEINQNPLLLPNTFLEPMLADTLTDIPTATYLTMQHVFQKGTSLIIGEFSSNICQQIGYLAQSGNVPNIAYACTAADFSNRAVYPTFNRVTNVITFGAASLANMCQSLGWNKVAIIFTADASGQSAVQAFKTRAQQIGVQVLTTQSYLSGSSPTSDNIDLQVAQIAASNARIIICYLSTAGDTILYFKTAQRFGLVGTGYAYLGGPLTQGLIDAGLTDLAQGIISFDHYVAYGTPPQIGYTNRFNAFHLPAMFSQYLNTMNTSLPPPFRGHFTYDPTYLSAYAFHQMIEVENWPVTNPPTTAFLKRLLTVIRNTTFVGLTGPMQMNSIGDRLGNNSILNAQGTNLVNVGSLSYNGQSYLNLKALKWAGNGAKPVDDPALPYTPLKASIRLGVSVVAAFSCVNVAILAVVIVIYRKRPSIQSASVNFLLLMLLGSLMVFSSVIARCYESLAAESVAQTQTDSLQSESSIVSTSATPASDPWMISGCFAEFILVNVGYTIYIGSLVVKILRLHKIFNNHTTLPIARHFVQDGYMFIFVVCLAIADIIILISLRFADPLQFLRLKNYTTNSMTGISSANSVTLSCSSNNSLITDWYPSLFGFRFLLLACLSYLAFRTRNLPDRFNESRFLVATSYNLFLLSILLPIFDFTFTRGSDSALLAYSICLMLEQYASISILMVPKLLQLSDLTKFEGTVKNRTRFTSKSSGDGSGNNKPNNEGAGGVLSDMGGPGADGNGRKGSIDTRRTRESTELVRSSNRSSLSLVPNTTITTSSGIVGHHHHHHHLGGSVAPTTQLSDVQLGITRTSGNNNVSSSSPSTPSYAPRATLDANLLSGERTSSSPQHSHRSSMSMNMSDNNSSMPSPPSPSARTTATESVNQDVPSAVNSSPVNSNRSTGMSTSSKPLPNSKVVLHM